MRPAVEFDVGAKELHLLYSPRDGDDWVHSKFDGGETLVIKGTFHLTSAHLVRPYYEEEEEEDIWDDPLRFRIATIRRDYFRFDPDAYST